LDLLARYPWPGNIRELRNVLERVLLLADDVDELMPAHLPSEIARVAALHDTDDLKLPLHEVERRYIARVLTGHRGNRVRTARTLGISRAALYDKLRRFGLADVGRVRKAARTSSVEPSS
jgi:transcriptional regulator with PAS, ATPase and Fis domain